MWKDYWIKFKFTKVTLFTHMNKFMNNFTAEYSEVIPLFDGYKFDVTVKLLLNIGIRILEILIVSLSTSIRHIY